MNIEFALVDVKDVANGIYRLVLKKDCPRNKIIY